MNKSQKISSHKISKNYSAFNNILQNNRNFIFMNHGYFPIHEKARDYLLDSSASLYCQFIDKIKSNTNVNLLDIGCGRGGGAHLMRNVYGFYNVHACDYNEDNIKFCKETFSNIHFSVEDAQELKSYSEDFFDYVFNIESSHCYPNKIDFFKSVYRVLKNDGLFFYADIFRKNKLDDEISQYFDIIEKKDITYNVLNSCEYIIAKFNKIYDSGSIQSNDYEKYDLVFGIFDDQFINYQNENIVFISYTLKKR